MHVPTTSPATYPDASIMILGAGSGNRMGGCSKAFLKLGKETYIEHAVRAAKCVANEIVIGLAPADISRGRELVDSDVSIIAGGATRQETIERLAETVSGSVLVVHDVARPFVTAEIFNDVLQQVPDHPACVPAIALPIRDSLCRAGDGYVDVMVDRRNLTAIQTPQAFDAKVLRHLLEKAKRSGINETSLVALFTQAGFAVKLVEGDPSNIKITYPSDLPESNQA